MPICDDLFRGLILLVEMVQQAVEFQEIVEYICTDEVRPWHHDRGCHVLVASIGSVTQVRPGQHQTGCLAADLAASEAMVTDRLQVGNGQKLTGDADEP